MSVAPPCGCFLNWNVVLSDSPKPLSLKMVYRKSYLKSELFSKCTPWSYITYDCIFFSGVISWFYSFIVFIIEFKIVSRRKLGKNDTVYLLKFHFSFLLIFGKCIKMKFCILNFQFQKYLPNTYHLSYIVFCKKELRCHRKPEQYKVWKNLL